ncbi:ketopantoate reductase family protein [Paenibacillus sp. sgz500958]|uniref:ketopantoate reductase family protein n=1 Tax=Paenibacillus sp. sgz500958 TaxID=3242475 RepID=UPI0036D4197E
MIIDIIGAGSMGLLLGGKLALAGNEIRFWCHGAEQCSALNQNGLTIIYEDEREPLEVPADMLKASIIEDFPGDDSLKSADFTILTVKQKVLHRELPEVLKRIGGQHANVVCYQNGSGHMELLAKLLPVARLFAAVTTEAAKIKSSCEVVHAGSGQTWIGAWDKTGITDRGPDERKVKELIGNLGAAGFTAHLSNEVETMIYRKLMINSVINPLTAIWRVPNGELLQSSIRQESMRELFDEAAAVYRACGITIDTSLWEDIIEVCRATSGNISSMLADVLAVRETEIRWINGSIVQMGERSGIEVPTHRLVCKLVEGMIAEER